MTLDSEDEGMDLEPSSDHEEKEQQVPKRKVKARISDAKKSWTMVAIQSIAIKTEMMY